MSSFADDPRTVLDGLSDPVVVVDERLVITSANRAVANLIGVASPDDLVGQVGTDWVHEPDRLDASERLATFAQGAETPPVSLRVVREDGWLVWVEVTGSVISSPEDPLRVALSLRNVDWRHAADLDAARVVQRAHSLVSAALMLQGDGTGDISETLDAVADSIGSAVGVEVVVVHQVQRDGGSLALRARWVSSGRRRSVRDLPTRSVRLDRVPNWVAALNSSRAGAVIDDDHPAVRDELVQIEPAITSGISLALQPGERLLGALTVGFAPGRRLSSDERDYLEAAARIVGAALRRARAERQLVEGEASFRALFDHSSAIMVLIDPVTLRLADANEAAARFYGYEQHDMVGMELYELTVHTRTELAELVQRSGLRGSVVITDEQHRLVSGDIRSVEIHVTPVRFGGRSLELAIVQDVTGEHQAREELDRLRSIDELTGALDRRRFLRAATDEIDRATRNGNQLTLLVLDIDHFNLINHTWGHQVGDAVLVAFADLCRAHLRVSDTLGRTGGAELSVLLPDTGLDQAAALAERIRTDAGALMVDQFDEAVTCTVHIGGAQWEPDWTVDELFARADQHLLRAKQAGRDRFEA